MALPVTGTIQSEALSFFEDISIKHLDEHNPCESWRNTLLYFSHTVPSVHHAAIALALAHRSYYDGNSGDCVFQPHAALVHYNRAIQLLLHQETASSAEVTAITLLVCYLFTCFDHLTGNYVQALHHLRGGVELSRNRDGNSSQIHNTLIDQVTRRIRRLDMQAVTFLVDWTPVDTEETLPVNVLSFRSLADATDHLQMLIARVMKLCNTKQEMLPSASSGLKRIFLGQLDTWSRLFENMLRSSSFAADVNDTSPQISLLRLQHTIAWIYLSGDGPCGEMEYDNFLSKFRHCVVLANDMAAAHVRYSGSRKPTFTPEIGLVPALYIIGVKCRDPAVRRQALAILRRQWIREAVWDSISAARVVERVMEIEEGQSGGEKVYSMEQISAGQRIQELSWVHSSHGPPSVDITYTFCTQQETYTESLMLAQSLLTW